LKCYDTEEVQRIGVFGFRLQDLAVEQLGLFQPAGSVERNGLLVSGLRMNQGGWFYWARFPNSSRGSGLIRGAPALFGFGAMLVRLPISGLL
jgi:hypothetical protein